MSKLSGLCDRIVAVFSEKMNLPVPSVDTDLFDTGLLDSLVFVELLVRLEEELGLHVSLEDLEIDNFRSITRIAEFAAGKNGFANGK
jgi:acyl carrier protein